MILLPVSSTSRPASVAGAVAAHLRDGGVVKLRAIGAGAVNQAVKGAAIAAQFLGSDGIHISVLPAFEDVDIDGQVRTAIALVVQEVANGNH